MFSHETCFEQNLDRAFAADESSYQHKQGDKDVITAFFTPKFTIIDNREDMRKYLKTYFQRLPKHGEDLIDKNKSLMMLKMEILRIMLGIR